jgi:hypothetical protein
MRALTAGALAVLAGACARPPSAWVHPSPEQWARAGEALAALRSTAPREPYASVVRLVLLEPATGRTYDARGAIAVAPGRAMRLIGIGPAGATVVDAWVTPERWRVAVPAMGRLERGGADSATAVPVGFFRWWFLGAPLDGSLIAAAPSGSPLVLRAPGAMIEVMADPGAHLHLSRWSRGRVERIDWQGASLAPSEGDRAAYADEATGLRVEAVIEQGARAFSGDACAFEDPDGASCPRSEP